MTHDDVIAQLGEYTLGLLDRDVESQIDQHLATCRPCAQRSTEAAAVHRLAAIDSDAPPTELRSVVLDAAFGTRPPSGGASARDVIAAWEAEIGRFAELLADIVIDPDDDPWDRMCLDEYGLTVRGVVCHLIAAESLWADRLGVDAVVPETQQNVERRTRAVEQRHRGRQVAETIAEFDRVVESVRGALGSLGEADLAADSGMLPDMSVEIYLALRGVETWTHADDIRATLGWGESPPAAPHVAAMTSLVQWWVPASLLVHGETEFAARYRLELTGPGAATHDVMIKRDGHADAAEPIVSLTCDAVEFCKIIAGRRPDPQVDTMVGDPAHTAPLLPAVSALAGM